MNKGKKEGGLGRRNEWEGTELGGGEEHGAVRRRGQSDTGLWAQRGPGDWGPGHP